MPSNNTIIASIIQEFSRLKKVADAGIAQLADDQFFLRLSDQQNSIWVIIKHMAGNMRSRWTDFLSSDGEKPTRNRDAEFVEDQVSRAHILQTWEAGWKCLLDALGKLSDDDLVRTVTIDRKQLTAGAAIARQLAHYGWHVGQILLLAKHFRGQDWQYVTHPPAGRRSGKST